jgi:glyoxylase-like metal-dependent hydrolase (beta-lactamase superfamily II)
VADDTIIIPGHGKPVSNKTELKDSKDMLVAIRDKVANLKKQGKSRDETEAAKPTAAFDAKWGQFVWANKAIERTTDKTILVPGHGPVGNRAQLIAFRDMLVAVRDKVVALKSQRKSLEDIIAAKPTAAFDDEWGRFVIDSKFFTKLVYEGL